VNKQTNRNSPKFFFPLKTNKTTNNETDGGGDSRNWTVLGDED
jgi:hypothetical protein